MTSVTPRGQARRAQLLHATAELVADRGFHAVGIADIGTAAGVTGSAIYRHFGSKEEMLAAVLDRVLDDLLAGARAAIAHDDALAQLVRRHVAFARRNPAPIRVWATEAQNLRDDDRRRQRRKQREYVECWAQALRDERPEITTAAAVAAAHAAIGLINSVAHAKSRLAGDDLAALLERSALAALAAA